MNVSRETLEGLRSELRAIQIGPGSAEYIWNRTTDLRYRITLCSIGSNNRTTSRVINVCYITPIH